MNSSFTFRPKAAARRVMDVAAAVTGLLMVAPAMTLIGILIYAETPGPVIFSQPRLGRDGKLFQIYKFRKFHHNADNSGCGVTLRNDPRMTRVGRLLERSKLDELPQLWNILRGDMSVVGPRPETLEFSDCFTDRYRAILNHRPGLFGPSQTLFRNESLLYPTDQDPHDFYRKVLFPAKGNIDLAYFADRTLVSDILWVVRGFRVTAGMTAGQKATRTGRGHGDASWATRWLDCISNETRSLLRKPLT